ncbi:MAG: hypothetical protein PHS74_09280 [Lachnospiraceae bacterium]|nr:hypothetical protein [Lachnospiraceae bacterium]
MAVICLEEKNITEKIADYIMDNRISVVQTARDLGISESKLLSKNNENLDADEFLRLCSYLNLNPESFKRK